MQRLPFNDHSKEMIQRRIKRMTHRWKPIRGIRKGMEVAAVGPYINDKGRKIPAFLSSAARAFAHLMIVDVLEVAFDDFTEQDAIDSGFNNLEEAAAFYKKADPIKFACKAKLTRYVWHETWMAK